MDVKTSVSEFDSVSADVQRAINANFTTVLLLFVEFFYVTFRYVVFLDGLESVK